MLSKPGKYAVVFDNTFSMFSKKEVSYRLVLIHSTPGTGPSGESEVDMQMLQQMAELHSGEGENDDDDDGAAASSSQAPPS